MPQQHRVRKKMSVCGVVSSLRCSCTSWYSPLLASAPPCIHLIFLRTLKTSFRLIFGVMILCGLSSANDAAPLAVGGAAGAGFPLAHRGDVDPGLVVEGFARVDPYELRFGFQEFEVDYYSVLIGMKYFFSEGVVRPHFEAAIGPLVVDTERRSLAYGVKPEISLGADLGVGKHFSIGSSLRYFGVVYWGDTNHGKMEANHGLLIVANVLIWF